MEETSSQLFFFFFPTRLSHLATEKYQGIRSFGVFSVACSCTLSQVKPGGPGSQQAGVCICPNLPQIISCWPWESCITVLVRLLIWMIIHSSEDDCEQ